MAMNYDLDSRMIDLLCVARPQVENHDPPQALDFELVVSSARGRGFSVETVGYPDRGERAVNLDTALVRWRPRCVYWHVPGRRAWEALRQIDPQELLDEFPTPLMVAGGNFATQHAVSMLRQVPLLDAVIRGEPEATLQALVAASRADRPWQTELGLTWRLDGQTIRNPPRPLASDIDSLAARQGDFFVSERAGAEQRILLSRGCSNDCQYCGLQTFYRNEFPGSAAAYWRPRTAGSVLDEIERFHRLGVRRFVLNSFVAFGQGARGAELIRDIAQGILNRGLVLDYRFVARSADLHRSRHLLPLLKRSGLSSLRVGLDSGLARPLSLYRVDSSREVVVGCLEALAREGIPFRADYIFYDPYSTLAEVSENLRFLTSLAPYFRHMAMPYSYFLDQQLLSTTLQVTWSTPLYEKLKRDGLAEDIDTMDRDPRIGFADSRIGHLFQAHQTIMKRFFPYLRPLFFSSHVVRRFQFLESFPSDLVQVLVECYEEAPSCSTHDAVRHGVRWIYDRVSPVWEDLLARLELDTTQQERMGRFLDGLQCQARAV